MSSRRSIHIAGFSHANPIPVASRVGNFLMSGVVTGRDPHTGAMPPTLEEQCANMFGHVKAIVEAAGGTTDDIIKITVWLRDPTQRQVLNGEWLKMFPDENARPARHTLPGPATGDSLVQCDVTAVFD